MTLQGDYFYELSMKVRAHMKSEEGWELLGKSYFAEECRSFPNCAVVRTLTVVRQDLVRFDSQHDRVRFFRQHTKDENGNRYIPTSKDS